ncbi:hypothetical protein CEXT_750341 [Caerostris extrusa]|uniref:Uncharacterized protein n=1 Tax=Caerostris extrusa TaxID=172846 RepID=A0AAV4XK35_CAEEX|nr:hypothetical protein CEXT_750341 [Caerostris extrusa]
MTARWKRSGESACPNNAAPWKRALINYVTPPEEERWQSPRQDVTRRAQGSSGRRQNNSSRCRGDRTQIESVDLVRQNDGTQFIYPNK